MTVVTRFPPSPTGFMHIGNARTALFNWLFARANDGQFLLRIEDTDRKRHSEEAVQAILDGLNWLGLDWDGDVTSQFARADRHREVAYEMLEKGQAYKCYCTPEELEEMRETAKQEGRPTAYDKRWRDRDASEAPEGVEPVIRIKAPLNGETIIEDKVQGHITVANEQIDDFIILRSDGTPTYMLAVVVDDYDMGVTHVIRGDDHLNNAFRQKVIYENMGWNTPIYAHTPLINGPDGKKFSKRHGAVSVADYQNMGYLSDAMVNYLLRLGWSHGDDEIISRQQAIEWFNLDGIGKSPAGFDFDKLENLNHHYIVQSNISNLLELSKAKIQEITNKPLLEKAISYIEDGADELKERSKTLNQFAEEASFYAKDAPLDYDEKSAKTIQENANVLSILLNELKASNDFKTEDVQAICKAVANDHANGKLGKVGMPLRAALTGRASSPGIFAVAAILGKDETCHRIQAALDTVAA